tara:strand:+ start:3782 stop:4228 length:447 start_codon:yes stop_codon:yes gene_type:complete
MTNIRSATEHDLRQVLDMAHALAAFHGDAATLTLDALKRDTLGPAPWVTLLVAEGVRGLRGYAALCPMVQLHFGVRGMDVHHLFVCDTSRGQGVGKALLQGAIACAKASDCRYITVGTDPDNRRAQAFYQHAGFSQIAPGPRFRIKLA